MFKKKFKVRVSHFSGIYYTVDYCSYRIFPLFWRSLTYWFNQGFLSETEEWSLSLYTFNRAEEVARNLKSIDDIRKWYKPEIDKMNQFKSDKKKYISDNLPYKSRIIN